jgi:hypothetical protein
MAMEEDNQLHEKRRFVFCSLFVFIKFLFPNIFNFVLQLLCCLKLFAEC